MSVRTAADYRAWYKNISGTKVVLAATDDTTLVTIGDTTNNTIYIQRIIFFVTTDAAQSMVFDDVTSGVVIAEIPASPGDSTRWDFWFGEEGIPLTQGESFGFDVSAAGLAGQLSWEGYEKRTEVGVP